MKMNFTNKRNVRGNLPMHSHVATTACSKNPTHEHSLQKIFDFKHPKVNASLPIMAFTELSPTGFLPLGHQWGLSPDLQALSLLIRKNSMPQESPSVPASQQASRIMLLMLRSILCSLLRIPDTVLLVVLVTVRNHSILTTHL